MDELTNKETLYVSQLVYEDISPEIAKIVFRRGLI